MSDPFIRTRMLVGDEPLARLAAAKVAVFGVGGVGGFCVEALARAGIGTLHLYDDDTVSESNLNRQLAALRSTIGRPKGEVLAQRVQDINPRLSGALRPDVLSAGKRGRGGPDPVRLCGGTLWDTVAAKLELAVRCTALKVPIISAMGSGQQAGPHRLCGHRFEQDPGLPPGPGDAEGAAEAGDQPPEGGLLHRGAPQPHSAHGGGGSGGG